MNYGIISGHSCLSAQQQQLLSKAIASTSEALAVEPSRIDANLHLLSPELTVTGGGHRYPFVHYAVVMLEGRTQELRQVLVQRYHDMTLGIVTEKNVGVKIILRGLRPDELH